MWIFCVFWVLSLTRGESMDKILKYMFVFFSTNIDFFIFIVIIFGHVVKKENKYVYIGYYIGTYLIIFAGLVLSYFSDLLPAKWMIGFLGFIPLVIGLKMAFSKKGKEDIQNIENKIRDDIGLKLVLFVIGLTLIASGDNIGVFISLFANLKALEIIVSLIVFFVMTFIFLGVGQYVANHPIIEKFIEKYEHIVIPIVFILLGIFILYDSGFIPHFLHLG